MNGRTSRTLAAVALGIAVLAGSLGAASASAPDDAAPATTAPEPEPFEDPPPEDRAQNDPGDSGDTPTDPAPDAPTETTPVDGEDDGLDEGTDGEGGERPSIAPRVRSTDIDVGSIVLAVAVLVGVVVVSRILARRAGAAPSGVRRRTRPPTPTRAPTPTTAGDAAGSAGAQPASGVGTSTPAASTVDTATLDLLIDLGEALIDAGDAVSHVESTLRSLGTTYGIDGLGVLVLPTALVVSVPGVGDVKTEVTTAGRRPLRLDQVDDVIHLVNAAERGEVTIDEGRAELARIRTSDPPFGPSLVMAGYVLSTVGIALVLRGGWREVVLAAALGLLVGWFRRATRRLGAAYQPFLPLIAAAGTSTVVFASARLVDELLVFPALVAPLITFLPGALLTTAVLELATGQIVAGAARLASGALQLVLLALGILAGVQLVGVPGGDIRAGDSAYLSGVLPWIGVAAFGVGVVWFNGARRSTLLWILVSMYAAFAGQVIGGLFFGSSLSAFFGAATMTPVALLAARQQSGPTPLVTFLPGFWILVPGALGLEGVTRIIGPDVGSAGTSALTTTVVSMVGISLGILFGLALVASDPDRPWADTHVSASRH